MARRKAQTNTTIDSDTLPADVVEKVSDTQNLAVERSEAVLAQFADGLPYDRKFFVEKCRTHMARSADEALSAGRCLLVLKEHEPHGEWMSTLVEIGVEETLARRVMQAALKFSNRATSHNLLEAAKSKSKLFELMVLDDETLEALNDGETVLGIDLDDVDKMSVSQLRNTLRNARADNEALGEVLEEARAERDDALKKFASAKRRIKRLAVEEAEKELRREAAEVAFQAELSLSRDLREVCSSVLEFANEKGMDYRGYLAGMVRQLELKLIDLREEFDLPDDGDPEDFSWMGKEMLDSIENAQE